MVAGEVATNHGGIDSAEGAVLAGVADLDGQEGCGRELSSLGCKSSGSRSPKAANHGCETVAGRLGQGVLFVQVTRHALAGRRKSIAARTAYDHAL